MTDRSRQGCREFESFEFALDALEPRRMLDCSAPVEMIEITRLDGGESFWVRADDPVWGTMDPQECSSEPPPPSVVLEPDLGENAEAANDNDLYNFGQDRGEFIDDDAEYEAEVGESAAPDGLSDDTGAVEIPRKYEVVPTAADGSSPEVAQPETDGIETAIEVPTGGAIVPVGPKISWLGDGGAAWRMPGLTLPHESKVIALSTLGADVAEVAPSWMDIAALPV